MEIREATPGDAFGIAKVQVKCWRTTYRDIVPNAYLEKMTYEKRVRKWKEIIHAQAVYVAVIQNVIVGFANGGQERTSKFPGYDGELYALYILREYQGRGIGKLLLKSIVANLEQKNMYSMTVSVLADTQSKFFYEHLGAVELDRGHIEIAGKSLCVLVYGWADIREIQ